MNAKDIINKYILCWDCKLKITSNNQMLLLGHLRSIYGIAKNLKKVFNILNFKYSIRQDMICLSYQGLWTVKEHTLLLNIARFVEDGSYIEFSLNGDRFRYLFMNQSVQLQEKVYIWINFTEDKK